MTSQQHTAPKASFSRALPNVGLSGPTYARQPSSFRSLRALTFLPPKPRFTYTLECVRIRKKKTVGWLGCRHVEDSCQGFWCASDVSNLTWGSCVAVQRELKRKKKKKETGERRRGQERRTIRQPKVELIVGQEALSAFSPRPLFPSLPPPNAHTQIRFFLYFLHSLSCNSRNICSRACRHVLGPWVRREAEG